MDAQRDRFVYISRKKDLQRTGKKKLIFIQLQLEEIEKLRQNGSFKEPGTENIPEGQAVVNFLLRGCYRIMAKMLSENVPVAEALMPVHNQLSTVRRCLIEVTKWGKPDSIRDLYP